MLISPLKLVSTNVGKNWTFLHMTLTELALLNVLLPILLIILLDVVFLTVYSSQAHINLSMELKGFAFFNVRSNILPITVLENASLTVQAVQIISLIGSQEHVSAFVLKQIQQNIMLIISQELVLQTVQLLTKVHTEIQ